MLTIIADTVATCAFIRTPDATLRPFKHNLVRWRLQGVRLFQKLMSFFLHRYDKFRLAAKNLSFILCLEDGKTAERRVE